MTGAAGSCESAKLSIVKGMAMTAGLPNQELRFPWRPIGWTVPVVLLLVPLLADWPWTGSDFVFAAVLFGSVGLAFELIVRRSRSLAWRAAAALAVIGAFLTVWVNGAVGMIGSEDNPYNLLFLGVPLGALLGSLVARSRSDGMVLAMTGAGVAQAALGAYGLAADFRGGVFSMMFAGIWLLSAGLFHLASRQDAGAG
jgi:hypothetical protein